MMDEFFKQLQGTPSEGCNDGFTGHGTDILDEQIAQGMFAAPSDDPAIGWVLQRYLYQKFKNRPNLLTEQAYFPTYMNEKEGTSVGRFHGVNKAIAAAFQAEGDIDEQSEQSLVDIGNLLESMEEVDNAIEQSGTTDALLQDKKDLIFKIHGLHWVYDSLRTVYEGVVATKLQEAFDLNQAVPITQQYEANEKTVNEIHLRSLMQQGGQLTEEQVSTLQAISLQDPKQGGPAVHVALGMLPDCARPVIKPEFKAVEQGEGLYYAKTVEERTKNDNRLNTQGQVQVAPNPNKGVFYFNNPQGMSGIMTLTDLMGRKRVERTVSDQETNIKFDLDIPPGAYLLYFNTNDGAPFVKKIIVQSK